MLDPNRIVGEVEVLSDGSTVIHFNDSEAAQRVRRSLFRFMPKPKEDQMNSDPEMGDQTAPSAPQIPPESTAAATANSA